MWQPRPPEKSSMVLPSTSVNAAPYASAITAGACRSSASVITRSLRSTISRVRGPGSSVTRLMVDIAGPPFGSPSTPPRGTHVRHPPAKPPGRYPARAGYTSANVMHMCPSEQDGPPPSQQMGGNPGRLPFAGPFELGLGDLLGGLRADRHARDVRPHLGRARLYERLGSERLLLQEEGQDQRHRREGNRREEHG